MYDEFGNYIGPDIESDESEKEEEEEEREVRSEHFPSAHKSGCFWV